MPEIGVNIDPAHVLAPAIVGGLLLLWGRKLYWLALGAVGFLLGLWLAQDVLPIVGEEFQLAISFLFGILGAVAAIFVQKIAVKVAGLILGGGGVLWLAAPHLQTLEPWMLWAIVLAGAIFGLILAQALFHSALVLISSLVGANLLSEAFFEASPYKVGIFLALFVVGVLVQSRGRKKGG